MSDYTFPFDTCEKPNTDRFIAQPYSAIVNIINCIIIFYFLLKTKKTYTFLLLFSIFCFELFHVFSHVIHIIGSIQINITHALAYCINISFLYTFYKITGYFPKLNFIIYYLLLVGFDIYSIFNMNVVFYIFSQALLFISVLLYYYRFLPKNIQNNINYIIFFVGVIILLFLNEKFNCKKMLEYNEYIPYHIFI